jgi:predicted metal-dependent phosphoesterase TrpH
LLIDLHTHTYPKSDDSFVNADDLIDRAKTLGLDAICLTEHDEFWSLDDAKSLSRRHDFLVLPGSEINTDAGHILVFGLHQYVFGLHKPAFLRQALNKSGGVMIAAHPYRRRYLSGPGNDPDARAEMLQRAVEEDFFLMCDAIEGYNGRGKPDENEFSGDLCNAFALSSTAGSDAHSVEQLGTVATRFDRRVNDLETLVAEIKAGSFRPEVLLHPA